MVVIVRNYSGTIRVDLADFDVSEREKVLEEYLTGVRGDGRVFHFGFPSCGYEGFACSACADPRYYVHEEDSWVLPVFVKVMGAQNILSTLLHRECYVPAWWVINNHKEELRHCFSIWDDHFPGLDLPPGTTGCQPHDYLEECFRNIVTVFLEMFGAYTRIGRTVRVIFGTGEYIRFFRECEIKRDMIVDSGQFDLGVRDGELYFCALSKYKEENERAEAAKFRLVQRHPDRFLEVVDKRRSIPYTHSTILCAVQDIAMQRFRTCLLLERRIRGFPGIAFEFYKYLMPPYALKKDEEPSLGNYETCLRQFISKVYVSPQNFVKRSREKFIPVEEAVEELEAHGERVKRNRKYY